MPMANILPGFILILMLMLSVVQDMIGILKHVKYLNSHVTPY